MDSWLSTNVDEHNIIFFLSQPKFLKLLLVYHSTSLDTRRYASMHVCKGFPL
jgi:hypothetical protein